MPKEPGEHGKTVGYKLGEAKPRACGMIQQAEKSHMEAAHSRQVSPTTWPAYLSIPKGLRQLCREGISRYPSTSSPQA